MKYRGEGIVRVSFDFDSGSLYIMHTNKKKGQRKRWNGLSIKRLTGHCSCMYTFLCWDRWSASRDSGSMFIDK